MKALEISKIKEEDEDMEDTGKTPHRNFWSKHPLPFFIGTKEYFDDDFVGLQYESEGKIITIPLLQYKKRRRN